MKTRAFFFNRFYLMASSLHSFCQQKILILKISIQKVTKFTKNILEIEPIYSATRLMMKLFMKYRAIAR